MTHLLVSPWLPLTILVILTIYARWTQESWLAPSAFAGLIWSLYVLIPLVVAPEFPVSALTVWVILALISSLQVGAFLMEGRPGIRAPQARGIQEPLQLERILRVVLLSALLATVGVVYHTWRSLGQYGLSFSGGDLIALGSLLSAERYVGENEPLAVRLLVMWVYPAALLGGIAYVLAKTRRAKLISFSPFVPALLLATVVAARAGTFIAACCWLGGFLATNAYATSGTYRIFSRKAFVFAAVAVIAVVGFIELISMIRGKTWDQEFQVTDSWIALKTGILGYLAVFSDWVTHGELWSLNLGSYTFAGLFEMMGLHARAIGIYSTSITLAGGEQTNIYTAFRGLIQDFSLPGAIFFFFIVGLVSGLAYCRACQGRWRSTLVLSALYAFLAWSPVISLSTYNSLLLAWVVSAIVFNSGWALAPDPPKSLGVLKQPA